AGARRHVHLRPARPQDHYPAEFQRSGPQRLSLCRTVDGDRAGEIRAGLILFAARVARTSTISVDTLPLAGREQGWGTVGQNTGSHTPPNARRKWRDGAMRKPTPRGEGK